MLTILQAVDTSLSICLTYITSMFSIVFLFFVQMFLPKCMLHEVVFLLNSQKPIFYVPISVPCSEKSIVVDDPNDLVEAILVCDFRTAV